MVKYQILYWKHIPAQIKVFEEGRKPVSQVLPDRFQQEIDRIAMEEGLAGTDDYLNQWHWTERMEHPGSAEEVLKVVSKRMEEESGL